MDTGRDHLGSLRDRHPTEPGFMTPSPKFFCPNGGNMKTQSFSKFTVLIAALATMTLSAFSQTRHCSSVGGTISTDLAVVDQSTTLGTATGDLKGAVTAAILNVTPNSD